MEIMAPLRLPHWIRRLFPRSRWDNQPDDRILLSFDDGPGPLTEPLLEWARDRSVQCLFFVLPENAMQYPDLLKRMQADGHLIGSHFLRHTHYWHLRKKRFQEELARSCRVIEDILGEKIHYCRAPYGRLVPWQESWIAKLNLTHVFWSLDSRDYRQEPLEMVLERLRLHLRSGDLILMHDGPDSAHPDLLEILEFITEGWEVQKTAG